jgi:hypothetical protein
MEKQNRYHSPMRFPLLLILAALAACSPSTNPAYKQTLDSKLATLQPSAQRYPAGAEPLGFAAGYWVRYRSLDEDGRPILTTQVILDTDGTTHKFRTLSESYYSRTLMNLTLRLPPGAAASEMEILEGTSQEKGEEPRQMGSMELDIARRMLAQTIVVQGPELGSDEVATAAGTFEGATQSNTTVTWGPFSRTFRIWHHNAVPMSGTIRSVDSDGGGEMELVGFGTEGAPPMEL